MPFNRPTINQIIDRVEGDMKSELGVITILRRSFLKVISKAIGGTSHVLHGNIEYNSKQIFPDTAETEQLNRWASIWGIVRKAATFANLEIEFSGTEGTSIPAASELSRVDGVIYTTDDTVAITTSVAGVAEISRLTTVADIAGSLNGKYFIVYDDVGSVAFWFDHGNGGTIEPAHGALRSVEITTLANGESANSAATKIAAAVEADAKFTSSASTNLVSITSSSTGSRNDISAGTTGFTATVLTQGVTQVIGGTVRATATAVDPGEAGNLDVGEALSLTAPIAGVNSDAEVTAIVEDAANDESDDALRLRVLDRIQSPPNGGAANDFVQVALGVPGVTRAWVFPNYLGVGTVGVTFVTDDTDPIIPDSPKVQEVQDAIDLFKPATCDATVFAPIQATLNLTIEIKPNTADVQAAILAQLIELVRTDAAPAGAWAGPSETYDGKILLSRINEAISLAVGEEDHNVLSPLTDFTPSTGQLAVLGTITWQTLT